MVCYESKQKKNLNHLVHHHSSNHDYQHRFLMIIFFFILNNETTTLAVLKWRKLGLFSLMLAMSNQKRLTHFLIKKKPIINRYVCLDGLFSFSRFEDFFVSSCNQIKNDRKNQLLKKIEIFFYIPDYYYLFKRHQYQISQ